MSSSVKNPFVIEFGGQPEVHNHQPENNRMPPASEESVKGSHSEVNYIPATVLDSIEEDEGPRAVYSKLETASTVVTFVSDGSASPHSHHGGNRSSLDYPIDEPIHETLLAFLMSSFYLCFSLGIAHWHYSEGHQAQATATLVIVFISAIIIQLVYAFHRELSKAKIWDTSKIFAALTVIPGTLPIFLSFADLIFAIKEANNRSYVRPWKNTHLIYLVESLVLALPQCVLQSVFLIEDPESIPKIKGLFVLFSLGAMTMGIALARVRYDSARRPDRFGAGLDKLVREAVIWGNKGLWITTYALLVVTARLIYPDNTIVTVTAILCLFVVYEVPILLSSLSAFRSCVSRISGMFFLIPQFVSLFVLIMWVNSDPTVYLTNVGICAMGAFSWFESLSLIGWLLDGCNDREMDILPLYPHFLGDFYSSSCCCNSDMTN